MCALVGCASHHPTPPAAIVTTDSTGPAVAHAAHAAAAFQQAHDLDAFYAWASNLPAPVANRPVVQHRSQTHPTGDRAACILARENGGDYGRSSNPTHFGAYQFDRQTWAANGGDPNTWGSATPAEQDRVFANTVSRYGYTPWAPYDGC